MWAQGVSAGPAEGLLLADSKRNIRRHRFDFCGAAEESSFLLAFCPLPQHYSVLRPLELGLCLQLGVSAASGCLHL